jgi:hypothetical protein
LAAAARNIGRHSEPTYGRRQIRLSPSILSGRVERMYVACVAFALGAAGSAIGFTFGVVPYYRDTIDFATNDWFFVVSVLIGALIGLVVGLANGQRWYRSAETSPLLQRRMLAYIKRRGVDGRGVPQRSLDSVTLRNLIGTRRISQA